MPARNILLKPEIPAAALSRNPFQHRAKFSFRYRTILDQRQHHAQVGQKPPHGRGTAPAQGRRCGRWDGCARRPREGLVTPLVEFLLLVAPVLGLIVGHTTFRRLRLAVRLATSKLTAKVRTSRVARIADEFNPAIGTRHPATGQFRLLGDRRLNTGRVPLRQVPDLGLAVPVGDAPVAMPDFYREKASVSLTSLKGCSFIASSLADFPIVRERKDEVFLRPYLAYRHSVTPVPSTWNRKHLTHAHQKGGSLFISTAGSFWLAP